MTARVGTRRRVSVLVLVAGMAVSVVAGCTAPGPSPSPTVDTSAASPVAALPPVFIVPSEAEGRTYQVPLDRRAVFAVGEGDPESWTGTVTQAGVVRFELGRTEASASFNPAFVPVAVGRTAVTMTDGTTTCRFTIEVTG